MSQDQQIEFDIFIEKFFTNKNNTKMVLELMSDTNDDTTIYDIHVMLLQIFFIGITKYEIPFDQIQNYYNNINIKLYVENYSIKDLINDNSNYGNRFIRIDQKMEMIKNGSHDTSLINELKDIKSFYTNNNEQNLRIYFDHILL
jgi:hypothetical protein